MSELKEQELDVSYAQGFLEEWSVGQPPQVKENLTVLASGVAFYRQKYLDVQEDYTRLQTDYNRLAALSAQYLQAMQQQKEQMDQLLIDTQREFHQPQE